MAPSKSGGAPTAPYAKDEKVLCFHHELLYEAKVLDVRMKDDQSSWDCKIHYKGRTVSSEHASPSNTTSKNRWDDWVPQDRVMKFTQENRELADQLHREMKNNQKPKSATTGAAGGKRLAANNRANGSDFSSARGSEERHASVAAQSGGGGRGPRRNRDYDLEQLLVVMPSQLGTVSKPLATSTRASKQSTSIQFSENGSENVTVIKGKSKESSDSVAAQGGVRRSGRTRVATSPGEIYKPPSMVSKVVKTSRSTRGKTEDWANHKSKSWDVIRFLEDDSKVPVTDLDAKPPPNFEYIVNDRIRDKMAYRPDGFRHFALMKGAPREHPKIAYHQKNGTITRNLRQYYASGIPVKDIGPIAGKIYEEEPSWRLKDIHGRIIPGSAMISEVRESLVKTTRKLFPKLKATSLELRDFNYYQEESFHARPSIKIVIPDHIKAILVDDWENITKNNQLVPLPAEKSVNQMLDDYLEFEKPKRAAGSAQADILEEVVAGLKEYFEKCLGRILLYRFERNQYLELRDLWLRGEDDKKSAGDVYGAEHLCRLLVTLPELIAQTNMDLQSVNRLREELTKLTQWIGRNATQYFVPEYETPGQEYLDKARAV
ncbi:histone acetylase complex subunit protein [Rutstroemia sp. NJR-2017a BBW]|nr:histone acetylase complex subunit protein [Rutstroemia sp. NJR-2017a BBW]